MGNYTFNPRLRELRRMHQELLDALGAEERAPKPDRKATKPSEPPVKKPKKDAAQPEDVEVEKPAKTVDAPPPKHRKLGRHG